jgi:hypothetical protein
MLALAKRVGLTFTELNELRVADLFDFADSYFGLAGGANEVAREATQADIDAFYRG